MLTVRVSGLCLDATVRRGIRPVVTMLDKLIKRLGKDKTLLVTVALTFASRGIMAFGTLFLNLVLARLLGPAGVGLFMLGFSLIMGLAVLGRFGMDSALLRFGGIAVAEVNAAAFRGLRRQSVRVAMIMSLLLAVTLLLGREWIAREVFKAPLLADLLLPFGLLLPAYTFIYLQGTWLKVLRKPMFAPFFETGSVAFATAALAVLATLIAGKVDAVGITWLMMAATLLTVVAGYFAVRATSRKIFGDLGSSVEPEAEFHNVLPDFLLLTFSNYLVQWGSFLIAGLYVSSLQLGLLSTAIRLSILVNFVLVVFNSVIASQFAAMYRQKRMDELDRLARSSTLYMMLMALPIVLCLVLFPGFWLGLFGKDFQEAAPMLIVLALAQFVNVSTGSVGFLLGMTGHNKEMRKIVLFTGALALLLSFLLPPLMGVWGAAVANASALVIQNLLAAVRVSQLLGIKTIPGWHHLPGRKS